MTRATPSLPTHSAGSHPQGAQALENTLRSAHPLSARNPPSHRHYQHELRPSGQQQQLHVRVLTLCNAQVWGGCRGFQTDRTLAPETSISGDIQHRLHWSPECGARPAWRAAAAVLHTIRTPPKVQPRIRPIWYRRSSPRIQNCGAQSVELSSPPYH